MKCFWKYTAYKFNPFVKNVKTAYKPQKSSHSRHTVVGKCHQFSTSERAFWCLSLLTPLHVTLCAFNYSGLNSTTTNPIESNKFYTKSPLRQIQTICHTYWNLLFLFMALPCNHLFQKYYVHTNIACECVIYRFMHIFLYLYNKFCFSTENCMIIIESIS